mgnify:CR=1 FL=1
MKAYRSLAIGILFLSILPSIYRLSHFKFWQDEAETVLVASSLSNSLVPLGRDSTNSYTQQFDKEMGIENEWKLHPWFQFYWAYGVSSFFGKSDLVLRSGFAFFSLLTLALILLIPYLFENKDLQRMALLSAIFLGFNIGFVLLTRQVRYYAPNMFFLTASIVLGLRFVKVSKGKYGFLVGAFVSTLLLLHTNYLSAIALVVASSSLLLIHRSKKTWMLLISQGLAIAVNIPFLLWMLDSPYVKERLGQEGGNSAMSNFFQYIEALVDDYFQWPFVIVLGLLLILIWKQKEIKANYGKPLLTSMAFVLVYLAVVGTASSSFFTRYLCGLLPLLALIKGQSVHLLLNKFKVNRHWPVLATVVLLLISEPYGKYWKSLSSEKKGPISAMVELLEQDLPLTEDMVIFCSYGDLSLKWYFGNQVWGSSEVYREPMAKADIVVFRKFAMGRKQADVIKSVKEKMKQKNYMVASLKDSEDRPYEVRETPDEYFKLFDNKRYPKITVMAKKSSFQTEE